VALQQVMHCILRMASCVQLLVYYAVASSLATEAGLGLLQLPSRLLGLFWQVAQYIDKTHAGAACAEGFLSLS
jgi:hypothetical protein